jgi:hypothetical protein
MIGRSPRVDQPRPSLARSEAPHPAVRARAAGPLARCCALPIRGRPDSRAVGFGRSRGTRRVAKIECWIATCRSRLMWVLADVVGPFSIKVGPFSRNVGQRHRIFSANVVPKRRMLSGPAVYVCGPLQLIRPRRVVLIDDVVTRGATFLGAASRVQSEIADAEIKAFALARAITDREIEAIRDPVVGSIELGEGGWIRGGGQRRRGLSAAVRILKPESSVEAKEWPSVNF